MTFQVCKNFRTGSQFHMSRYNMSRQVTSESDSIYIPPALCSIYSLMFFIFIWGNNYLSEYLIVRQHNNHILIFQYQPFTFVNRTHDWHQQPWTFALHRL